MESSRPAPQRTSSVSSTESKPSDPFLDPPSPLYPAHVPLQDIEFRGPKPFNPVSAGYKVHEPSNLKFLKDTETGRRSQKHTVKAILPRNTWKGRVYRVFGKTATETLVCAAPVKTTPAAPKQGGPEAGAEKPKPAPARPARVRGYSGRLISKLELDPNYFNSYEAEIASDKAEQQPFEQYLKNGTTCLNQGLLECKRKSLMDSFTPSVYIGKGVCTCSDTRECSFKPPDHKFDA